jgi:site-specific DNA-methyltransferase (adenine-specific)
VATAPGWTLYRSRWEAALADAACDALIFDAPYSKGTHEAETTRSDGYDAASLTPNYDAFTEHDVRTFCEAWAPRCRGWMVSITDSILAPTWRAEMERVGRYAFAPVPCVLRAMSVRIQQDGPSSWAVYAMVSRPRTRAFSTWGILPGAYVGTGKSSKGERGGGRGKPQWLMQALVRDYTRPGDIVVDPFAGWGSTLAAAVALGRTAIGAEMDAAAFAEARRRLERPLQVDLLAGLEVGNG